MIKTIEIFVFGSNLAGRHGAGAARYALLSFGARYGCGEGLQGRSYAIPTKDERLRTLPLDEIARYARHFIDYAEDHRELTFHLTAIGCGLAGYKPAQIAPFFRYAPPNVILPSEFSAVLFFGDP